MSDSNKTYIDYYLDTVKNAASLATDSDGKIIEGSAGVSNDALTVYAAGTSATVPTTWGLLTFGTTSPSLTITAAGTYLINSRVRINTNNCTHAADHVLSFLLYRTNNTPAQLANSSTAYNAHGHTADASTEFIITLQPIIYTTANTNDVIELWGLLSDTDTSGTHDAIEACIVAVRLY
jgi:hypothetical protein